MGSELREGDELTRESLGLVLNLMLARLDSFFSQEKMAGRPSSTADVEQLANFLVATIQGGKKDLWGLIQPWLRFWPRSVAWGRCSWAARD